MQLVRAGDTAPLPAGVELAAYRIVQEALTNVVRHAATDSAQVRIERRAGDLCVEVTDAGPGPRGATAPANRPLTPGHGLVGMRERVRAYGGTLEAGPAEGGGFRVAASIPLPALAGCGSHAA